MKKKTTIRKGAMEWLAGRVRDLTKMAQLGVGTTEETPEWRP